MAAETSLVDALKAIPAILKLIPDTQTLPALTVLVVLVIVVAILRTDILKQLSQEQRDAAVMFIIRYVFVGAGMICIVSFTYAVVSIKSASAQLQNGITKPASTAEKTPGSPVPIVSSDAIAKLSDSLVLLSYRLNPPPGIEDALAQLKAGNAKPAIDILNNNILAEQKDKSSRAATLRQIGLLEFYKDTQASLATYQQSVLLDPDSWEAWGQIAYLLERSGDHAGAVSAAQKAVDIGTKAADIKALGLGYGALGYIEANAGRIDSARPLLEKARGYFLAAGSKPEYALATNNLARIDFSDGNFDEAIRYYEEALETDIQINNQRGIAADYAGLAQVYSERGRESKQYDKALEYFAKSIAANESVGDPHQTAIALSGMANVYRNRRAPGDLDKAKEACIRALALEKQIDNRSAQVVVLGDLAEIAQANQDFNEAEARYAEAIQTATTFKLPFLEGSSQRGLGTLYLDQKKLIPALDAFRRALQLDKDLKRQKWVALDQSWVGVTYDALEQKTEACASWKEAADIYEAIGAGDSLDEVKQARADAGCS